MDRQCDIALGINTTGLRDWDSSNTHRYNRTESTPYKALDFFFSEYEINPEIDQMVDYGCGKGRMLFYIYNKYKIPVTGIELNDLTFDELSRNLESYSNRQKEKWPNIRLVYGYAEKYQVDPKDNIFYFFNPFNLNIFKQCIRNIEDSVIKNPRDVDVILYYPLDGFVSFMEKATMFTRDEQIRLYWKSDPLKKFLIFKYRI